MDARIISGGIPYYKSIFLGQFEGHHAEFYTVRKSKGTEEKTALKVHANQRLFLLTAPDRYLD